MDDDFEVEVTDLRSGRSSRRVVGGSVQQETERAGPLASATNTSDDVEADDGLERTTLDGQPVRRRVRLPMTTRQRRHIGALIASCAVLLAIVVAFVSTPNSSRAVAGLLNIPTPTPTAPIPLGGDELALTGSVPWGTLTIDGKPVPALADALMQQSTISVARGRHVLRYSAPPFASLTCTISVPKEHDDTCPLIPVSNYNGNLSPFARVVEVGDVPERLPARLLTSLTNDIATLLQRPSAPITIEPGDHYVDASGATQVATEPMLAQQVLTLATGVGQQYGPTPAETCNSLCPSFQEGGPNWIVQALVTEGWRYSTSDGQALGSVVPAPPALGGGYLPSVSVEVRWDAWASAWRVSRPQPGEPNTPIYDSNVTCFLLNFAQSQALPPYGGGTATYSIEPADPTEGCAEQIHFGDNATSGPVPTPDLSDPIYLYRLGVLTAVNDQAATAAQSIPRASSHEAALVAQWQSASPHG